MRDKMYKQLAVSECQRANDPPGMSQPVHKKMIVILITVT